MSIVITAAQRDVLREEIMHRLSGIDDVRTAFEKGDYEAAQRLGVAFSDDLRLVTEDLGWKEDSPGEIIELKTPPDVLRRSLGRTQEIVSGLDASEETQRSELQRNQERNQLVLDACRQLLAELDDE